MQIQVQEKLEHQEEEKEAKTENAWQDSMPKHVIVCCFEKQEE